MNMHYIWLLWKMYYANAVLEVARRLHITAEKLRVHSIRVVRSVEATLNR